MKKLAADSVDLSAFQDYLTVHNMANNTIHVSLYAIEQFYSLFPHLTISNLQLYKIYLLEHYKP